jgi:hypothetical protein
MKSKSCPANAAARVWRQVNLVSLNFGSDSAPPGLRVPTATEVQAMGAGGHDLRRAGRVALVDHIGTVLAIPRSGCDGQARLFEGPELRLRWPLGQPRIFWPKDRELRGNWGRGECFGNRAEPGTGSAVLSTVLACSACADLGARREDARIARAVCDVGTPRPWHVLWDTRRWGVEC